MQTTTQEKTFSVGVSVMKNCRKMSAMISRFVDRDLTVDEARDVSSHIDSCKKCSRIHESYLLQKDLIAASFSNRPLPVSILSILPVANKHHRNVRLTRFIQFGFAGSFVVLCIVVLVLFHPAYHPSRTALAPPVVILESIVPSTMSSPLSALVYYEELAGKTIHSQFVKITSRQRTSQTTTNRQYLYASYYESPLFHDNMSTIQQYTGDDDEFQARLR